MREGCKEALVIQTTKSKVTAAKDLAEFQVRSIKILVFSYFKMLRL